MPFGVQLQAVYFVRSVKMFDREMYTILADRDKIELYLVGLPVVLVATKIVEGKPYQRIIPLNHVETMVPAETMKMKPVESDQETRSEPKPTRSKRR